MNKAIEQAIEAYGLAEFAAGGSVPRGWAQANARRAALTAAIDASQADLVAALEKIASAVYEDRSTVHEGNAFEAFGRLNTRFIELTDLARAALARAKGERLAEETARIVAIRKACDHHWYDHLDGTGHCTKCGQRYDGNRLLP